jgi:hypothetical protein
VSRSSANWKSAFNDDDFHHIRIEVFDPADGNPFDGSGPATVRASVDYDGTPFFSFTRTNGFISNYISLIGQREGSEGDGVVRHALTNVLIWLDGCTCDGPGPAPVVGLSPGSGLGPAAFDLLAGAAPGGRRIVRKSVASFPSAEPLRGAAAAPVVRTAGSAASTEAAGLKSRRAVGHLFAERLDALTNRMAVRP